MEPHGVTLIEGVGDEVTVVAGIVVLIMAVILAWLSTYVADGGHHLLGAVMTTGDSSVIHLSPIEHYVGSPGGAEHSEPASATAGADEAAAASGAQAERSPGSEATLDRLLDIQALPQRSFSQENREAPQPTEETEPKPGLIKVRLKFLNDTEEVATVRPEDTVGILKR